MAYYQERKKIFKKKKMRQPIHLKQIDFPMLLIHSYFFNFKTQRKKHNKLEIFVNKRIWIEKKNKWSQTVNVIDIKFVKMSFGFILFSSWVGVYLFSLC